MNNMIVEIIGVGVMGTAIAEALSRSGKYKIYIADKDGSKARNLARRVKATADSGFACLPKADHIIIAVKPKDVSTVGEAIAARSKQSVIVVSIAAGIPIRKIQKLTQRKKILRLMPNLGIRVGQGIAAWKSSVEVVEREKKMAAKLLDSFTENFEVKQEKMIDAVTAISGSGPAYFLFLAGALEKAAMDLGFPKPLAKKLTDKTLKVAAALQDGVEYQDLINQIASKKGTTEAALMVFEKRYMKAIVNDAAKAAYKRAKELSGLSEK